MDIFGEFFRWYIIIVSTERILDLLGDELQAGQHIQHEGYDWNDVIAELKDIAKWKRHHVYENEFLDEDTIGIGDGSILDTLTCATYIGE